MIADDARPRYLMGDLFPYPGGGTLLCAPGGSLLRITQDQEWLSRFLAKCDGNQTVSELAGGEPDKDLRPFLTKLLSLGCVGLACEPDRHLVLLGDAQLAGLAAAMTDQDVAVLPGIPADVKGFIERLPQDAVPVVLAARPDMGLLERVDDVCMTTRRPWSHLYLLAGSAWFGPHVTPGLSPRFADLRARQLAAVHDTAAFRALAEPAVGPESAAPSRHWLTWALAAYVNDLFRWLDGEPACGDWHEVELRAPAIAINRHPVLPHPACPATPVPDGVSARGLELLVDDRTGIVTKLSDVTHHPSIPSRLRTVHARTCHVDRITPWRNDPAGGGSVFDDAVSARAAAIGEAVERYCGNIVQADRLTRASFAKLSARGERPVDPDQLVLFSERQYGARGFPFEPFTQDLSVFWVAGRSLSDQAPAWLPASLVYPNWFTAQYADEPKTNGTFFPGLAAGATLQAAVAAGIQETIERHATMVWWLNAQPLPSLRLPADLADLWPTDGGIRAWAIHLDNEFGVPVVAGLLENQSDGIVTAGFAARPEPQAAILKAWSEAATLQDTGRDLLNPRGARWTASRLGQLNGDFLKPWRADRRYLDDYRADGSDVTDLICQVQAWLDPRAVERIRSWADLPPSRGLSELTSMPDGDLSTYLRLLGSHGLDAYYTDLTTPDVAAAGITVVRVLIPGLIPNSPAAFPYLGRSAVQRSARNLGWLGASTGDSPVNYFPMPHA